MLSFTDDRDVLRVYGSIEKSTVSQFGWNPYDLDTSYF